MTSGLTFVASLPATVASASGFYPTPEALAKRLLSGVDWTNFQSTPEPSAGKDDLAEVVLRLCKSSLRDRRSGDAIGEMVDAFDMDCVEIDPNLRAILKARGFRAVGDDFLRVHTCKRDQDFTPEEKAAVDSLEGKKYNETLFRADYFLSRPAMALLAGQ